MQGPLSLGDRVELAIEGPGGQINLAAVVGRVAANRIVLSFPKLETLPEGIEPGCRASLRLPAFSYAPWRHTVVLVINPGPPPSLEVERLTDQHVQRRRFFRVEACLRVSWLVVGPDGAPGAGPPSTGVTDNLGAGGMRMVTSAAPSVQDLLRVHLELPGSLKSPGGEGLHAEARVRRIVAIHDHQPPRYSVALQLMFRIEAERDHWVQLMFELQRALPR